MKNKIKNNEFYLDLALEAAQKSRKILLKYFGRLSKVKEKEKAGLVSEADLESERCIQSFFKEKAPEIEFMGEESAFKTQKKKVLEKATWIVDPLDGTTNYVHRFPIYCISIGLEIDGELQVGVIDVPALNDTYWAIKGGGAYKNGNKISVSQRSHLKECLVATGFYSESDDLKSEVALFSKMLSKTRAVRRPGAAAYDLCMVAEGIFDLFWERNLQPWDTAAGTLLVREAGGLVKNFEGEEFHPNMKSILATNSKVQLEALDIVKVNEY